jgi:PTS system nitrogen regulatory IIA component
MRIWSWPGLQSFPPMAESAIGCGHRNRIETQGPHGCRASRKANMKIQEFLAPADAMIGVKADDKNSLLRNLSRHAASSVGASFEQIATEILKREALGSTGIGLLARLRHPIDFDAIDAKPVDLVFLLLLPVAPHGEQLNALASVARLLRRTETLRELRRAASGDELYRAITAEF